MELKLSQDEVKTMLLESIGKSFPGKFNTVKLSDFSEYSTRGSADFSYEERGVEAEPIAPAPPSDGKEEF